MRSEDVEQLLPKLGVLHGRHPTAGRDCHGDRRSRSQASDDFPGHDQAFQLYPAGREQTREPCLLRVEPFHLGPAHRLLLAQQSQHLIEAHQATPSPQLITGPHRTDQPLPQ